MSKSLQKIGVLELTKTCINKEIGDLVTKHRYDEIVKLELEDYFRDVTVSLRKSNSLTKSLKIFFKNQTEEVLIISSKSLDFKQKISVVDSLNTLKKITEIDIRIKYN
ncbi:MAG TPA: hypothetical protein VMT63_07430 [Bacteroidales bacterium]|nr:hypothetical protein [Bacteroidales bacterium]